MGGQRMKHNESPTCPQTSCKLKSADMDWRPSQADTTVASGKSEQASHPVAQSIHSWLRKSPALDRRRNISEASSLVGQQFSRQHVTESAAANKKLPSMSSALR